jgi:hypothetical protein
MSRSFSWFIIAFFFSTSLAAEQREIKQEREIRISRENFPKKAIEQLEQLEGQISRLKFYKELDNGTVSFEAKFQWHGLRWSMEFDKDGAFMDLEQYVSVKCFFATLNPIMLDELKGLGKRYKVLKVQKQFSWAIANGRNFELSMIHPGHKGVLVRYELEVEVENARGAIESFELLIGEDGRLLRKRTIVPFTNTHLLY